MTPEQRARIIDVASAPTEVATLLCDAIDAEGRVWRSAVSDLAGFVQEHLRHHLEGKV